MCAGDVGASLAGDWGSDYADHAPGGVVVFFGFLYLFGMVLCTGGSDMKLGCRGVVVKISRDPLWIMRLTFCDG